ncbi:putative G2/M transition transcriptional factor [Ordospora colligata]|uniref:Putative G2/M transition transcriptional factor n=1 Tax=Ordospora colligata OC4 TaxID=1354746 RepID=A0A0B2ULB5_9MICR|nr:putative G2/M transition transcriptional factor [Ordospora colligata OC4]KHN70094.1 putative G2/M transition transcriptional factor [Ordospora colligata OC4]TBU16476.1 putative G2/M transition transcriptional factor [Ordospora colligata]TBU16661.1 putative G2/M transition transcriptional factor [Ordospora colligata]TBU19234.1 putative G2/M transition transcriptional factor [Ordospora colligata]
MGMNELSRLKKLYQIEESRFAERLKRHEDFGHMMDSYQFCLEGILLKREEMFYKYDVCGTGILDYSTDNVLGFDHEFINKNASEVSWGGESGEKLCNQNENCESKGKVLHNDNSKQIVIKEEKGDGRTKIVAEEGESKPRMSKDKRTKGVRIYACDIDGCSKKYTSSFGLKYHMKEGHSEEKMNIIKPFGCPFSGCDKKYKNNNGLKYHIKHYHDETS